MAVEEADVRGVIVGDTEATTANIDFYISWAEDLVSDAEALAGTSYAANRRERIKTLVAAHGVMAPEEIRTSTGQSSVQYPAEPVGAGLQETSYGRKAIQMDNLDVLDKVGLKTPVFESYGTTYDASDP